MYLKRLDLQGFKSFPDKIKLEFQPGITAIVGPNGSGKSNISDAIRWVLGEQKARSLRGDKMEDVIFLGTEVRKPLGFAEVAITIDNAQHEMPIDYTEVTVTRRVFRSGESEYLINGMVCRLKDIHELFMDTGVGKEGYSIISQGRIDEILSTKSEDRRKIFEEAAGIIKHKTRKNEAIAQLEKEQQNLCRIEDIISELEEQMGPLKEQADTAKEYLALKEQLKKIEVSAFCANVDKIEAELNRLEKNKQISQDEADSLLHEGQKRKEEIISIRKYAGILSEKIQEISDDIIALRTKAEQKEGTLRVLKQQIFAEEEKQKRLQEDLHYKTEKTSDLEQESKLLDTKLNKAQLQVVAKEGKMAELEKELLSLNRILEKNTLEYDQYQENIMQQIRSSTELKGQISQNEVLLHQLGQRQEQLEEEIAYQEAQIHTKQTHLLTVQKQLEDLKVLEEQKIMQKNSLEQERNMCLGKMDSIKKVKQELEHTISQKKSRLALLHEMEQEYEGFFKSVKSILQLKQQEPHNWKGIHGAVGELLRVSPEYETAIEVALGSALQNIVTETEEDAKKAIQYLKTHNLGRGTFLPISSIKGNTLHPEKDKILLEKSVLGIASQLISFAPTYHDIFSSLLGRIVVVNHIDSAIHLAKKYLYRYKIVTLDGDIINTGGAITGGSHTKKVGSMWGRSREIQTLTLELIDLETKINENMEAYKKAESQIAELEKNYSSVNTQFQTISTDIKILHEENKTTHTALEELNTRMKQFYADRDKFASQITAAQNTLQHCKEELLKTEQCMEEMNLSFQEQQTNMLQGKNSREMLLKEITEAKVALSVELQEIKNLQEMKYRFTHDIAEITKQIDDIKQQEQQSLENRQKYQQEILAIKTELEASVSAQQEQQLSLTGLTEKRKKLFETVSQLEEISLEKMEAIAHVKNELYRLQTKIDKLEEEKQRLYQDLWDEYEMTYQSAKEFGEHHPLDSGYKQLLQQLKSQLKNLGNVNVTAIEQYKTIKERHQFLTKQRQDIVDAKAQLTQMMKDLSILMEDQFKKQFREISENFNTVFREIFEGGKAYLRLEDSDNVLDSPIEIIAQPPGKSLQNMMLLSGGERALTAIAILFAILKMKPSPFCILDEIEAALDDVNVKRYARYLKKFSDSTQFIVITHRKGTMEAADVLYGVTMQEKGISRMVSVQLDEYKK